MTEKGGEKGSEENLSICPSLTFPLRFLCSSKLGMEFSS